MGGGGREKGKLDGGKEEAEKRERRKKGGVQSSFSSISQDRNAKRTPGLADCKRRVEIEETEDRQREKSRKQRKKIPHAI